MKTEMMKREPLLLIWPDIGQARSEINLLDKIRNHRNEIIISLLEGDQLKEYLFFHFRVKSVSESQVDDISKTLMGILLSPLDLNHYCRLIKKLSSQPNSILSDEDELDFHYEIETLIKQYFS